MAHVRKDTLSTPVEYAKHCIRPCSGLRAKGKRIQSKAERQAAKAEIAKENWNKKADGYNQWSELGQDEKDELIQKENKCLEK